jgi:HEAT repeat protein
MDPVAALLADLRSPDPDIRFSVLTRATDLPWTPEQRRTLGELAGAEADAGLQFQMRALLARLDRQSDDGKRVRAQASDIEILLQAPERDDLTLAMLLGTIGPGDAPLVALALREHGWWEFSTQVLPAILQFFKKWGSFEDVEHIEPFSRHHDPRLIASAVEALEKLSPDSLRALLVPLLTNPSPGIRSRAVRLLWRWDQAEALRHLEAMLFAEDPTERQAALLHAFFVPFPDIEPLLFKFLGVENDPELLTKAGLLFKANPAPHLPLRLLEAREASLGGKRMLIGDVLIGVMTSLHQAGLVEQTPDQQTKDLEAAYRQRKARQILDRCALALKAETREHREAAIRRLFDLTRFGLPDAVPLLQSALQSEPEPDLQIAIKRFLDETVPDAVPLSIDLAALPPDRRRRFLTTLDTAGLECIRGRLDRLPSDLPPDERVLLIQALRRIGTKRDAAAIRPCLQDSHPEVLAAAIEALGHLDPDALVPFLPPLLKHSAEDVRAAAIRIFALFDKRQALKLVEQMLSSVKPLERGQGIFSAGQFDFPTVRDLLLQLLHREQDPANIRQICAILRDNIDEPLYFQAFRLHEGSQGHKRTLVGTLLKDASERLIEAKSITHTRRETLDRAARAWVEAEEKRQRDAAPSYSLQNITKIRQQQAPSPLQSDPGLLPFTIVAVIIGALLTALIWFLFLKPATRTPTTLRPGSPTLPSPAPLAGQPRNVLGTVVSRSQDALAIIIEVRQGTEAMRFRLRQPEPFPPQLVHGATFRGQIKPTERRDGEVIEAELLMTY